MRGSVRIDGAAVEHWSPDAIGRDIGYLPQDVQLFEGTVAENIARFDPDSSAEKIMTAAIMAGAHDMIQRLANGYETRLDGNGTTLSGGQQQRIGLARVLYGNPFLVVLDEPNSNLDSEGDEALLRAVRLVRERGGIVIMVTHRPTAIAALDMVAVMADGHMKAIGPRDEVLRTVLKPAARQEAVASGDGSQAVRPKPVVAVAKPVPPAVAAAG
jgi:ATP-binding cassette subfamily C protein